MPSPSEQAFVCVRSTRTGGRSRVARTPSPPSRSSCRLNDVAAARTHEPTVHRRRRGTSRQSPKHHLGDPNQTPRGACGQTGKAIQQRKQARLRFVRRSRRGSDMLVKPCTLWTDEFGCVHLPETAKDRSCPRRNSVPASCRHLFCASSCPEPPSRLRRSACRRWWVKTPASSTCLAARWSRPRIRSRSRARVSVPTPPSSMPTTSPVMGARPRWFLAVVLLPPGTETSDVRELFTVMYEALDGMGVTLVGGHTEITNAVTQPLVVGQMMGSARGRRVRADRRPVSRRCRRAGRARAGRRRCHSRRGAGRVPYADTG